MEIPWDLLVDASLKFGGSHPAVVEDTRLRLSLSAAGLVWGYFKFEKAHRAIAKLNSRVTALEQNIMVYSQRDARWKDKQLGTSGLTVGDYGCYISAVSQLLLLAGYNVTPGDICDTLNANKGFTKDGLAIHKKIMEAYPQITYYSGPLKIVQGKFKSGLYHYMAARDGVIYDPWTGGNTASAPLTGVFTSISITPAPIVVSVVAPPEQPSWPRKVTVKADPYLNNRIAPYSVYPDGHDKAGQKVPLAKEYPKLANYQELTVIAVERSGESVDGNCNWYKSVRGNYFSAYYTNQPNP